MTAHDMHIEFEQSLQQVAANKTLKYLPPEVDWILNKMQDRFIQLRMKPKVDARGVPSGGFEVSQLDSDAIRTIIVSSYDLVPYLDQDGRRYRCLLPPDYSYLLSDWSYTTPTCGLLPATQANTMYVTALRQDRSIKTSGPYYANIQVQLGSGLVTIPSGLPYPANNNFKGFEAVSDIDFIRKYISLQGQWYWERFDSLYYPNYHIFATTNSQGSLPPYVSVDGNTTTIVKTSSYPLTTHPGTGTYYDNRLSATSNISGMTATPFIKSSYYSPISELSNGILYVYKDNSFTISNVGIAYVRKPQPISLYLGTNCELPEEFHQNICDLAVEYVKGRLNDFPGYQQTKADNDSRVML
jgi:hypothetical protein